MAFDAVGGVDGIPLLLLCAVQHDVIFLLRCDDFARKIPVRLSVSEHAGANSEQRILHLNGYRITNPTILVRIEREESEQLL